jgi:TP901 family phage tail tape measure protein
MGMLAPVIAYLGMDITGFKTGAAESKTIMRGLSGEQGTAGVSKGFKAMGAVATAGALALGVASVHMAGDFDASMTRMVTSAGETKANLGMVSDGVLKLAVDTGTSTTQLAQGLYMIESAGYHGAAGLNVLRASAQGARAEGADLNEVANAVTSALNAYHLPASQAVAVTDQLVATVSSGKMRMQDLASSISSVLPVAAAARISLSQVGGAIATMTMQGMSADQATQDLAFTIRSLQAPSGVARQAMASLGLSGTDLAQNLGTRGLTGTLQMVSDAILHHMGPDGLVLLSTFNESKAASQSLNTMLAAMPKSVRDLATQFQSGSITASQYSKAIKQLPVDQQVLGQQFETTLKRADGFQAALKNGSSTSKTFTAVLSQVMGGATGLNTALLLTGGNAKVFSGNVKTVSDAAKAAGANVNGWSDIQGTFNFKLSKLKETAEVTGIRIGNVLIPAIMAAVGFFGKHQNAALALAGVIGGVLLASMVNFAVATTVATAKGAVFLAQTIAATVADWAETVAITAMVVAENVASAATAVLDAVMDANPIVLIVLALVALGAALYEAYEHVGPFRRIVQDAFHAVGAAATWLWNNAIKPAWNGIVAGFKWVGSTAVEMWQGYIEPAIHGIGAAASWLYNNAILPAAHGITAAVHAVGAAASWLWRDIFEPVGQGIAYMLEAVGETVGYIWSNILEPIFGFFVALLRFQVAVALFVVRKVAEEAWRGIAAVAKWAWENVLRPTWNALVAGTRAVGAAGVWLWNEAIKPAIQGIATGALWLWNNAVKPAWAGIVVATHAVGAAAVWLWDNAFKPTINALGAAALWLWHNVIEASWRGMGAAIQYAWTNVIKPTWAALTSGIDDIKTAALWLWHNAFEPAFQGIGSSVSDAWHNVIKPIFDTIKRYIDDIVGGFNKVVGLGKGLLNGASKGLNSLSSHLGLHLADGGWVPGAVGQAQLAVVHGGEYMLSHDMITGSAPIDPSAIASTAGGLSGGSAGAAFPSGGGSGQVFVNVNVQGSVIQTDRQLVDTLSEVFAADGRRNNATYPAFAT